MYLDELCTPCQAALRHGRASDIAGPVDRRRDKYVTRPWACALCVAIRDSKDIHRSTVGGSRSIIRAKGQALQTWTFLNFALKGVLPFGHSFSNLHRTREESSMVPVPPICDLADILLMSPYLRSHSTSCLSSTERPLDAPFNQYRHCA
jgi:hypothetical protein